MYCTTNSEEKEKYHKTPRNYRNPDLVKVAHNISITDGDYALLRKATKISGLKTAEFIVMLVKQYLKYEESNF